MTIVSEKEKQVLCEAALRNGDEEGTFEFRNFDGNWTRIDLRKIKSLRDVGPAAKFLVPLLAGSTIDTLSLTGIRIARIYPETKK